MINDLQRPILKRWMWGLLALCAFLFLMWQLGNVAILLSASFLVAYVLNPLVTRLARLRFLGRTSATTITMVGLTVGFFTFLFFIVPQVAQEARTFIGKLPGLTEKLQNTVVDPMLEKELGIKVPHTWDDAFNQVYDQINKNKKKLFTPAAQITKMIFGTTFTAIFVLVSLLMFPLFLFFLLRDFPIIIDTIDGLIPLRNRATVRMLVAEIDLSLSRFLHGQFLVMLVLGCLYSLGYMIVGIPLGLGVGLLTGMLCFIPYVGAATGFVLALLMAIFSFDGWHPIAGVSIVFALVQTADAVLITPRILGEKLGLQPLWIIVALMAGSQLFGFLGVLLAVPTAAVLKILVPFAVSQYRQSELYITGPQQVVSAESDQDQ